MVFYTTMRLRNKMKNNKKIIKKISFSADFVYHTTLPEVEGLNLNIAVDYNKVKLEGIDKFLILDDVKDFINNLKVKYGIEELTK